MKLLLISAAVSAALLFSPAHAEQAKPATAVAEAAHRLDVLADAYYDAAARFEPLNATESGDPRFDDQLGLAIDPTMRARQYALYHGFQARLRAIPRTALSEKEQINYDILDYELATELRFEHFPTHLLPVNQMDSVPITLANYANGQGGQPLTTVKQYKAYLNRLSQLPAWIDQAIANMKEGVKRGITEPKAPMESAVPQFKKLVAAKPEDSIFYTPVTNMPASFSAADKKALTAAYRATIASKLTPALARLADYLEKDYLPAARTSTGWNALPQGDAWYRARVASQTTTTLTPEQIHAIGLKEVARIQGEFAIVGPKMGYTGPANGLPNWVAAQAKFKPFTTDQQVIDVYRKLDAQLRLKLPTMFTLMPKAPLDLRLEPELSRDTASDHYSAPAADGSRPGVFWSVVTDPKQYGSTGMVTLFLHEGQPGHHFHIALLQELGLPNYRKFGGNNAFTEGWALYAETLRQGDGPVRQAGRLFRPPERRDAAGGSAGSRHRHAQQRVDAGTGDRLYARHLGLHRGGREEPGREIYGVAGPGARVQDRLFENRRTKAARSGGARQQIQFAEVSRDRFERWDDALVSAGGEGGQVDY